MGKIINVIKASGEIEPFSQEKLTASLQRAGAGRELAQKIVNQVKPRLYQNVPTFEIYSVVMKALKKEQRELADRYDLKRAIMELGPTGYLFEKFVAAVLEKNGYKTLINRIMMGKCVSHEVDIIATEGGTNGTNETDRKTNRTYIVLISSTKLRRLRRL